MKLSEVQASRESLLDWLEQQPEDRVVHDGTQDRITCNCLVATYLQDVTGNPNVAVGYSHADVEIGEDGFYDIEDSLHLGPWFNQLIHNVDNFGKGTTIEAKRALEIVENSPNG